MKAKSKKIASAVPLPLRILANYVQPGRQAENPDIAGALAVARRVLADADGSERQDIVGYYVLVQARKSSPKEVAMLTDLDIEGDIHNAFMDPALALGLALGYVMFAKDGGR